MEDSIMKRAYFALAVLVMAALTGCRTNEFEYDNYVPKKGEVVFRLANSNTRSTDVDASVRGVSIPIGDGLFLEETITRLGDLSYESFEPATKGTPAYTENFSDLYGDFKAAAFKSNSGSFETSAFDDGVFEKVGTALWKRAYGDDVQDKFPLYFFLRSPYDLEGTAVKDLKYSTADGSITFNYDGSTLTTASAQKDLLFTSRLVTEDEYDDLVKKSSSNPTGVPVLFHHALTGIKFANFFSNPDEDLDVKTYITKVEITGLKDGGKCVITPVQENGKYEDNKTNYSSATVAVWSGLTGGEVKYTQTFGESDEIDFAEDGTFGDNGSYTGTSFATAGNENNLNKADGSLTFWFVPQQLTDNVKMTVYYKIDNTKNPYQEGVYEGSDTIDFGKLTRKQTKNTETGEISYGAYATWQAGELRTYTLKPRYVKVKLHDEMSEDKFEKDNVVVTNDGNVWQYVRVSMIANWVGNVQIDENVFTDEETILNGYTTADEDNMTMVQAWNDKDGYTSYGTFTGLVPKSPSIIPITTTESQYIVNNWVRYDKYYYYIHAIGPNESITDDVFESYVVGPSPEFWIVDQWGVRRKAGNVHLIMDVLVQAIPAETNADGEVTDNYIDAWVKALDKSSPNDLLDL